VVRLGEEDFFQVVFAPKVEVETQGREDANLAAEDAYKAHSDDLSS
jgi:hypothetical protein